MCAIALFRLFGKRARGVFAFLERESLLVVVVGAYACGLLARLPDQLRQDGWLTLVSGRFVAHAGLPSIDSLTAWTSGTRWIDQQWFAQLLFYRLDQLGGLRLVMLTHVALLAIALACAVWAARWRGGSVRTVSLVAVAALITILMSAQFRAQSFAYVLFVLTAWLLIADVRQPSRRVFLVLPLLVLWANLHGSVMIGAALVALRGVFALAEQQITRAAMLVVAPLVCIFASPYGVSLGAYYRATALNPSFSRIVTEWHRATPSLVTAGFYVLALIAAWLVVRHGSGVSRYEKLALLLTFVAGTLALRNMVWFAYIALIVLPAPLARKLRTRPSPERPRFKVAIAAAAAFAALSGSAAAAATGDSWYTRAYPTAVARVVGHAAASNDSPIVFADLKYADWLLWEQPKLAGRIAYDARLELLHRNRLDELYDWTNRTGAWRAAIRSTNILVVERRSVPDAYALYRTGSVTVLSYGGR